MSPKPYPIFSISKNTKPEQIEKRIKLLIRLYVSQHEQEIATAVVAHIDTLLAYPKYITDIKTRCQLRHLSYHWRCLAWTQSNPYKNSSRFSLKTINNNSKVNKYETSN